MADDHGTIEIARRTIIQDLFRRYVVLIDGQPVGRIWPRQTRRYVVPPGQHSVRLSPKEAISWVPGRASSDEIPISVSPGQTQRLETVGQGASSYRPTFQSILTRWVPSGMYDRPWIVVEVTRNQ